MIEEPGMTAALLPKTFNTSAAGSCMVAARIIAGRLLDAGEVDVVIIEGYIQFIDEDGSEPDDLKFTHTWVMHDDVVIDQTFAQFSEYDGFYDHNRIIENVIHANEYMLDERCNTYAYEIFFRDEVVPDDVKQYLPAKPGAKPNSI